MPAVLEEQLGQREGGGSCCGVVGGGGRGGGGGGERAGGERAEGGESEDYDVHARCRVDGVCAAVERERVDGRGEISLLDCFEDEFVRRIGY